MDPLTQGVVGAIAATAVAQRREVRPAAGAGALAGMLPDADVLIRSAEDPLLFLDYHRHFTHSFAFIPVGAAIAAVVLWPFLRRFLPDREGMRQGHDLWPSGRFYLFCLIGYGTHGLLDACTTYGTQLLWPFSDLRVAWNVVSVIDPLFTVPLLALTVWAVVRRAPRWSWLAAGLGLLYLGMGTMQRERAQGLLEAVAAREGHEIVRGGTKPSIGNVVLWRGVYETADGGLHAVALRPGLLGPAKVSEVASAPRFEVEEDLPSLSAESRQAQDVGRFDHFSDGWLVRLDPATLGASSPETQDSSQGESVLVGDFRYAAVPDQIRPLWGIRVDPATPGEHVDYLTFRDLDRPTRERFFCMLRGGCLEEARLVVR